MSHAAESSSLGNTQRRFLFGAGGGARLAPSIMIGLALTGAVAAIFFVRDRDMLGYATLSIPVFIGVICHPRLALYQFVFCLFVGVIVVPDSGISVLVFSAVVVIISAGIDLALKPVPSGAFPILSGYFVMLLGALCITGLFAYDPALSIRSFVRVGFMFVAFLALVRLLRYADLEETMRVFFVLSVAHAVFAVGAFVASGGALRSFAFAPAILDDLLLLALPVGLAYYLGSATRHSRWYAIGSLIVFSGLLATQSRASLMFGILGAALVMFFMTRRKPRSISAGCVRLARSRTRNILVVTVVGATLSLIFLPDLFAGLAERFERLITTEPGGTFRLRLILWTTALQAFWDNPIVGTGPGSFTSLQDFYTTMHLNPGWYWVRGLSATSLFMHYLAETGVVGTTVMLALFTKQLRVARTNWKADRASVAFRTAIYIISFLIFLTTIIEAGWLWGHASMIAVFFLALISASTRNRDSAKAPGSE